MTNKKILFLIIITFLATSCTETFDSVKRGLTGAKSNSADEFLVKKKDPLILPPDFEDLPLPDEITTETEEISNFEKTLGASIEDNSSKSSSAEESILKKIRSK